MSIVIRAIPFLARYSSIIAYALLESIPNEGATNESGFSAVPSGGRIKDGDFYGHFGHIGELGIWWSRASGVNDRMLRFDDGKVNLFSAYISADK